MPTEPFYNGPSDAGGVTDRPRINCPFQRKPGLGRYNGSRQEWTEAYRVARLGCREGKEPSPRLSGLPWKAGLIVQFDRHPWRDPLAVPVQNRLASMKLIDEIVDYEAH